MGYSLDDFCDDTRAILRIEDNAEGREKIRENLERLLKDDAFRAQYLKADDDSGMTQIFEDPELGFCILAYNMSAPRTSPPHDHGRSWAVYGQAAGYTDMTIWAGDTPDSAAIAPVRTFRLDAGQAGLFDVRDIHSIQYDEGAKFVRVTGVDMAAETRRVFDPEAGTVKEVEGVSTGRVRQ